jgi:ankyrin repeat protein
MGDEGRRCRPEIICERAIVHINESWRTNGLGKGATPLMNAVQAANLPAVAFMLSRGADVNAQDYRGFTALHRAAEMGLLDIAKTLIGAGASPLLDAEGHSPRSFANDRGDPDMINLLSAA